MIETLTYHKIRILSTVFILVNSV